MSKTTILTEREKQLIDLLERSTDMIDTCIKFMSLHSDVMNVTLVKVYNEITKAQLNKIREK